MKTWSACLAAPLLACAGLHCASAQSYSWRNVEIGGGGFVTGTVFHPTASGLVYARTDVGGIYRLDTATNRWLALNDDIGGLNNEFQHLGVLTIGVDPNDANRLYLATGQYGGTESWKLPSRIYRSTNRGATWLSFVTPGFKMAGNGEGRGTGERMAVDPLNGQNILVGTSDSGVWRSTDYGATWTRLTNFTPTSTNFLLYAPANHVNPGPKRRVYAAASTATAQSFWCSDDNGTTWAEVPNHPGSTAGSEMMPIQGSFDAAGVFYATWGNATGPANYASRYGVWKLAAEGTGWTAILPPTGQGFFSGISADPRVAGHVVVSTLQRWWPGDEVYRSTDGGTTWTAALRSGTRSAGNSPWSAGVGAHWITDIDIDPFNSNRAIFNNGFGLIQTTNLSTSGTARRWTFFSDGLEETVPLGLLSPTAGPPLVSVIGDYTGFRHDHLDRSPLRGAHQPGSGSTTIVSGADLAPAKLIRQNSGTTLYSQDAAATWAAFPTTPAAVINGHHRVILSADGQRLLWCPPNAPAYLSNDNGATWNISTTGLSPITTQGAQTVSTLAGSAGVPGTTNATGGDARFNSPAAIAVDSAGVRYVADTANHTVRRIVAGGGVNTMAGGAGVAGSADATGTAARFNSPAGIAVDASKTVFVSDTANHTIRKITTTGVVTTIAGSAGLAGATDAIGSAARFNSPAGLATDSSGNVYVCDAGNHTIRKITAAGAVTTIAGSPGISGSTNAMGSAARFNAPNGITLDAGGNLYIADSGNHAIRKLTPAGDVTTFAGLAGTSGTTDAAGDSARFHTPKAIASDASGTFHVADSGNHTIRKITPAGQVTTVAGLAGTAGTAGGSGATARFNDPSGIAVTPDGLNFHIADTASHTIRRNYLYNTLTPLADRVDGNRLYLWDNTQKRMLTSADGGASFSVIASGVNSAFAAFRTVPGHPGHLWARAGASDLFRSTNFGATFTKVGAVAEVYQFDFGKAAPSSTHPAVFIWGKVGTTVGFFRSDDTGATWVRINDNLHNFGYQNDLAGDPRVYGRVYLATSGRGVVYGDFANPVTPPSQASQVVFDDALQNGWTNESPTGTSLTSTHPVRRGTNAIAIASGTGKGLALTCAARSLEGFAALAFWVNAGTATPPPLQVGVSRGGIALEAVPITVPASVGWQRVVVPCSDLGLSNLTDLTGLRVESRTVNGVTPGAFSLDDVEIVGNDEFNGTTTATITLANLEPTYSGAPRPVAATTTPAGLPVLLTYNGSTTAPTAVGTYAVSAMIDDPAVTGSATGTLVISKATAAILLGSLSPAADGTPKTPTSTTNPPGLAVSFTFNGSATAPTYAGSYAVVATINDANYQGSTSSTLLIRQLVLPATGITGWVSNIADKVTIHPETPSSPLLNPNDTTDQYSTNTLQARFSPITLANPGDRITLTGGVQLTAPGIAGKGNWFRFGLYDNPTQALDIATNWLGYTAMGNATHSLYERSGSDLVTTGLGATKLTPEASPVPVGAASPSGNPPLAFEITITRGATGIVSTHLLKRTDTNVVLLNYTLIDSTPNNNGLLTGYTTTANGYTPTYNTAGFAFGVESIGTTGAQAQFSNIQVAFSPGVTAEPQTIDFPVIADRAVNAPAFDLTATASSGLPVTLNVTSGPASLSENTLTVTEVGTVTVRASQAGNLNYLPAPEIERSFNVTKAPATITLGGLNPTYDGTAKAVTATTHPVPLTVTITYDNGSTAPTNAGSYAVSATINHPTYQGSATDTQVIAKAPQTITFNPLPNRTFGDAPFVLSATSDAALPVSFSVVSGPATLTGTTLALDGAGPVTLRASQPGAPNHLAATPVDRTFTVAKAAVIVTLANLDTSYDGQPKAAAVTTIPAGLEVSVTYNGSATPPILVGSYAVSATVDDPDYQGAATSTLVIGPRSHTADLTGWASNIAGKVSGSSSSSPLLNPNDTTDPYSTNTLQARFGPLTLTNPGDKITLTGNLQMTLAAVAAQSNWFRFGLYDNRNQATHIATGWLGNTGMGNALFERTADGLFSTGTGATQRPPDASPTPVSSTSPSGNPPLAFEVTATRTATGVIVTHFIKRTDTHVTLMRYSYTDTTPNNNGVLGTAQNTAIGYNPTYTTAGFAFARSYLGTPDTQAQFSSVRVTYTSATEAASQAITFEPLPNRVFGATPFALTATASSGLPVSYTVVSGPATLSENTVTVTGAGEVTIRASQAGDFTRLPALPVEQTFTVGKAPATITLGSLTHRYDGSAKSATATTVPANLNVEIRYDGEQTAPYQIGDHEVTALIVDAHHTGSASGTLVIEAIPQTISFAPLPGRTFGDAPFDLSASASSGLPVSFSVVSGPATLAGNTLTLTGAGTVTVRASQPGDETRAPAPDESRSFLVAKAPATALEEWRQEHFGTQENTGAAADNHDANGDGEPNLLEFATGQNPHAATRATPSAMKTGGTVEFRYTRSKAAGADGILFDVEHHDALDATPWTSAGAGEILVDGPQQTMRIVLPAPPAGQLFIRLKVSAP